MINKLMENEQSDYDLGFAALEVEDYGAAARHFLAASEAVGDDPDILYPLAYCYIEMSRYAESLPILKKLLKLRPEFLWGRTAILEAYTSLGDRSAATRAFKKYFKEASTAYVLSNYATLNRRRGKHEAAAALYAASLVLDPGNNSAYNNMAISLNRLGRHQEAIRACKKGLKILPGDCCLSVNLIISYRENGQLNEALSLIDHIQDTCIQNRGLLIEMGNVYSDLKRYEDAIEALTKAKEFDPSWNTPYINLGITYDEMGQFEKGENEFREALRIDPDDAKAHNNLGASLDLQKRYDEAADQFEIAAKLEPRNTFYRQNAKWAKEDLTIESDRP
jgi:tetratricopeptide (TPR) repeat protein